MDYKHLPKGQVISLWTLCQHGAILFITSYMCSMIVARRLSVQKASFTVRPNAELLGLGVANAGCAALGGFPCSGILATSLAVMATDAQTCVWSIVCGVVVIVLSQIDVATAMLAMLPKAVLSAIVIETVIPVISFESAHGLFRVMAMDIGQYAVTMFVCFLYGIEWGILAGMIVAVYQMVLAGTRNRVTELGRLPHSATYRNVLSHREALVANRVLIARVYDSLMFTNWYPCEDALQTLMDQHEASAAPKDHLIGVVINLVSCGSVDSTAAFGLLDFCKKHAARGIAIRLSAMGDEVADRLTRVGLHRVPDLGIPYKLYASDHEAVLDIADRHAAVHEAGSVHLSEVASGGNVHEDPYFHHTERRGTITTI